MVKQGEPEGRRPVQLGVLGGGQLGLMLAQALDHLQPKLPRSVSLRFFDRSPNCPVTQTPWPVLTGSLEDPGVLDMFSSRLDLLTYESENTPASAIAQLTSQGGRVFPDVLPLTTSQDRLLEKQWLEQQAIPTAPYRAVNKLEELRQATRELGFPGILKTRRFGYDGKGQVVLRKESDLSPGWTAVASAPCVYEGFVEFVREVSQISTRSWTGQVVHYPLTQNHHEGGILRRSLAPAPDLGHGSRTTQQARAFMDRLLASLHHVGTLTLELFELADGSLVANEMAPRVHNSGHWTIEGSVCSQFENHLRAGLGIPLGPADFKPGVHSAEMINFLGSMPVPEVQQAMAAQGWSIHDYGKKPAPGRKVGHGTRLNPPVASTTQVAGAD